MACMDPVSLTAATASLLFNTAKVVKGLIAIHESYTQAPLTLTNMLTQCRALSHALSQIQSLALSTPESLDSLTIPLTAAAGEGYEGNHTAKEKEERSYARSFDEIMTACMFTLRAIEDELGDIVEGESGLGALGFKAKAKCLWKEGTMKVLFEQIEGHKSAINLLLDILQTKKVTNVEETLKTHTALLKKLVRRAVLIRKSSLRTSTHPRPAGSSSSSTAINDDDSSEADTRSVFAFSMTTSIEGRSLVSKQVSGRQSLNAELSRSTAYQRAHTVAMEELWNKNWDLTTEKYVLLEKIEEHEARISELETLKAEHEGKISLYEAQKEANETQIASLNTRIRNYEIQLSRADAIREVCETRISKLESEIAELESLNTSLETRIAELQASKAKSESQEIELVQNIADALDTHKELQQQIELLKTEHQFMIERLENEKISAVNQLDWYRIENKKLDESCQKHEEFHVYANTRIRELREIIEKHEALNDVEEQIRKEIMEENNEMREWIACLTEKHEKLMACGSENALARVYEQEEEELDFLQKQLEDRRAKNAVRLQKGQELRDVGAEMGYVIGMLRHKFLDSNEVSNPKHKEEMDEHGSVSSNSPCREREEQTGTLDSDREDKPGTPDSDNANDSGIELDSKPSTPAAEDPQPPVDQPQFQLEVSPPEENFNSLLNFKFPFTASKSANGSTPSESIDSTLRSIKSLPPPSTRPSSSSAVNLPPRSRTQSESGLPPSRPPLRVRTMDHETFLRLSSNNTPQALSEIVEDIYPEKVKGGKMFGSNPDPDLNSPSRDAVTASQHYLPMITDSGSPSASLMRKLDSVLRDVVNTAGTASASSSSIFESNTKQPETGNARAMPGYYDTDDELYEP